jgi:predicted phage terminase large subunit-like protein
MSTDHDSLLDELANRKLAREHLINFSTYTMPEYEINWHHQLISDQIDRMLLPSDDPNALRKLALAIPPRMGKSELISRRLPAFLFGKNPNTQIIACSYGADLSSRINRDVQRVIVSAEYKRLFPETTISETSGGRGATSENYTRTSDLFEIVGHKGFYRSAGVGGAITGMGGHWLIVDDPFRNREDADSPTIRNTVKQWYKSTFRTRAEKDVRIIVVQTRWHPEDLIGDLLTRMKEESDADQFEYLSFPAIAEGNISPLDPRNPGDPIWPNKYSLADMMTTKSSVGSREWESLYQCNPSAEGAQEWAPTLFSDHIWWEGPWPKQDDLKGCVLAIDPSKGTDSKHGDYSAVCIMARTKNNLLLTHSFLARMSTETLIDQVIDLARQYKPEMIVCESNMFQSLIIQNLVNKATKAGLRLPAQGVQNTLKKEVRIRRLGPYLEQKILRFTKSAGSKLVIDQLKMFPSSQHDDGPDAMELALRTLIAVCNNKIRPASQGIRG